MTFVLVLIVALLVAAGVFLYVRRGGTEAREYRVVHHQLTKQHKAATARRVTAISAAEESLRVARSSHEAEIRDLERQLVVLRSADGRRLGSYQGITLNELSVSTPNGKGPLTGATAAVDTAGDLAVTRRATLTRTVAGGVLFGPVGAVIGGAGFKKKQEHDSRELYLTVGTTSFVSVVSCPPDQGVMARSFAARIQTAAIRAEQIAAGRPQQIIDIENRLALTRNNTGVIAGAEQAVLDTNADPALLSAVEDSRRALENHALTVPAVQHKQLPPS